jgi:MFS family permease
VFVSPDQLVPSPVRRLPFYYGWVVVSVAFVTMAIGVNVRTAFSLLFPPILTEFGWNRGDTAFAFSLGFITGALLSPALGWAMDRFGPRWVLPFGAAMVSLGLGLATFTTQPWHLYVTFGAMTVGSTVILTYTGHAMFLPHWFVRRRGLAMGIAFSGVGVGSMLLFPWIQSIIVASGWRQACWAMAALTMGVTFPLNVLLQRKRPADLGLLPDGAEHPPANGAPAPVRLVVDHGWTVARALASVPFWLLAFGLFCAMIAWYTVQVHQTKYLTEIGFSAGTAAFALGFVALAGIVGQIALGQMADRMGTEWAWTIGCLGFAACYVLLLAMERYPSTVLLYLMVFAQGGIGYGIASVFSIIPSQIFQGRAYGTIFGLLSLAISMGAGIGPWIGGMLQDRTGSYMPAFWLGLGASILPIACVWLAAPRKGGAR